MIPTGVRSGMPLDIGNPQNKHNTGDFFNQRQGTAGSKQAISAAGQNTLEETKEGKKKVQVGTGGHVLGKKDVGMMVSVKPVLEAFRSNTKEGKDVKKQFSRMRELEKDDEDNIVTALDQLTDILCQAAYFQKAFDILKTALVDYEGNGRLNEIMARVCFIMEQFDQCIYYNKQAKKLTSEEDVIHQSNLNSDIGLA